MKNKTIAESHTKVSKAIDNLLGAQFSLEQLGQLGEYNSKSIGKIIEAVENLRQASIILSDDLLVPEE